MLVCSLPVLVCPLLVLVCSLLVLVCPLVNPPGDETAGRRKCAGSSCTMALTLYLMCGVVDPPNTKLNRKAQVCWIFMYDGPVADAVRVATPILTAIANGLRSIGQSTCGFGFLGHFSAFPR